MKLEARALAGMQEFLEAMPDIARESAKLAMNDVTGGEGLTMYKKAMRTQIAFPAGYLEDVDRFGQTSYATEARLETVISARQRPTSLARFMTSGSVGQAGVTVKVGADSSRRLSKAFPVRLRAGAGLSDESFNLGLAVRIAPGQTIRNKKDTYGASGAKRGAAICSVRRSSLPLRWRHRNAEGARPDGPGILETIYKIECKPWLIRSNFESFRNSSPISKGSTLRMMIRRPAILTPSISKAASSVAVRSSRSATLRTHFPSSNSRARISMRRSASMGSHGKLHGASCFKAGRKMIPSIRAIRPTGSRQCVKLGSPDSLLKSRTARGHFIPPNTCSGRSATSMN